MLEVVYEENVIKREEGKQKRLTSLLATIGSLNERFNGKISRRKRSLRIFSFLNSLILLSLWSRLICILYLQLRNFSKRVRVSNFLFCLWWTVVSLFCIFVFNIVLLSIFKLRKLPQFFFVSWKSLLLGMFFFLSALERCSSLGIFISHLLNSDA